MYSSSLTEYTIFKKKQVVLPDFTSGGHKAPWNWWNMLAFTGLVVRVSINLMQVQVKFYFFLNGKLRARLRETQAYKEDDLKTLFK